jgi:hypothetical protein
LSSSWLIEGTSQPAAGISSRSPFPELARTPPGEACRLALLHHRHHRDDSTLAAAYYDE